MKRARLGSKTVLRLGPGAAQVLNAYATNTPDAPRGAFLDLKGRVLAAYDQASLGEDRALLAVERTAVPQLQAHLSRYLPLMGARLEGSDLGAWLDLEPASPAVPAAYRIPQPGGASMILTSEVLEENATPEEVRLHRLKHFMPLQGVDYQDEMILCLGEADRVSFSKGCYLGQEIVARVHYRGHPPKRLEVRATTNVPSSDLSRMTSLTLDPISGKTLGFIFLNC